MHSKKIMVAGYLSVDITPEFDLAHMHSTDMKDFMAPGKLLPASSVTVACGGCVTNTGLALQKLGADVAVCAAIGDDPFGDIAHHFYHLHHMQDGLTRSDKASTSYTIVIVPPRVDRIFIVDPGVNALFDESMINWDLVKQCGHFHFGYPPLMKRMYENGGEALIKIFKRVKEMGLTTSMDMALADTAAPCMDEDWKEILKKLFPYLDIFTPSVEELCLLIDPKLYESWMERAAGKDMTEILDLDRDIAPLADRVLSLGARILLLKCGLPGIYLRSAPSGRLSDIRDLPSGWDNLAMFEKSYKADRVLSGTGAGDTSIAAFLKSFHDGESPKTCMQLATATGACCVTEYDTLSGLKPLPELKERIKKGWEKYDKSM